MLQNSLLHPSSYLATEMSLSLHLGYENLLFIITRYRDVKTLNGCREREESGRGPERTNRNKENSLKNVKKC